MAYTIALQSGFSQYSIDLEFDFTLAKRITSGRTRSFTTITNQDPEAARHFGFQPGQENPSLRFTLYNNGEDKSNGSLASSSISDSRFSDSSGDGNLDVVTVEEQKIWLNEYVFDNTSDPRWIIVGGEFDNSDGNGTNVVIEDVNFEQAAGLTTVDGTIKLKLGVTV